MKKAEFKKYIGKTVKILACDFETEEHVGKTGIFFEINKDSYFVAFKEKIAGSNDCSASKIEPLKSPKVKRVKPQKETFKRITLSHVMNGYQVEVHKEPYSLVRDVYVFPTKARLIKWISEHL